MIGAPAPAGSDACKLPDPTAAPDPATKRAQGSPAPRTAGFIASAAATIRLASGKWFSRAAWGARPPRSRTKLVRREVIGLVLHWPGMRKPLASPDAVRAALRSWQAYHMDTQKWSDIAYQAAIDQWGNRYRLRGKAYRSAANGNELLNRRYGALLLVLAPGQEPSPAMLKALRRYIKGHRKKYPNSVLVTGHDAVRPGGTECPGPAVAELLKDGRL